MKISDEKVIFKCLAGFFGHFHDWWDSLHLIAVSLAEPGVKGSNIIIV